jgi:hypothetical protein
MRLEGHHSTRFIGFLCKILAIVYKDIITELRTKEMFTSMFVFALLVIVIFNFAFELRVANVKQVAPGVLWVTFTFAGMLGLNRSFILEKDKGCLEGLLLAPVDRSAIYFGKMLGNLIFMSVVEVIVLPIFWVFDPGHRVGHFGFRRGGYPVLGYRCAHPGPGGHVAHPAFSHRGTADDRCRQDHRWPPRRPIPLEDAQLAEPVDWF